MENNVRSPLAEQLERVESFTGMSVAYSKQSSDEFRSLSDAVTCLGSQVSQLRGMITSGLATTEEEDNDDFKYSCNTMIGIEEAFMGDKCVYCEQDFSSLPDWEYRGMHLIKNHMFGDCNFQANSNQPERFAKHLCVKHCAADKCHTQKFVYSKRRIQHLNRREPLYDSIGSYMAPENLSDDGDSENTPSVTQHEKSILHHLKQTRKCDLEDGRDKMGEEIQANYWNLHWRLNCLMERQTIKRRISQYSPELIVSNIFAKKKQSPKKLSWRMGHYYRYASSVCEPVTRGWRAGSCHSSNLQNMLDSLIENAALEVEVDHASMALLESRKRCREWPDLSVSRQDQQIDCWLLQMLAESDTAETIIPARLGMKSPDESSVYIWVLENLMYWAGEVEPYAVTGGVLGSKTDGAVDSRDDLASDYAVGYTQQWVSHHKDLLSEVGRLGDPEDPGSKDMLIRISQSTQKMLEIVEGLGKQRAKDIEVVSLDQRMNAQEVSILVY
jgi:hypothetical protein